MTVELSIQQNTIVNLLGPIPETDEEVQYTEILFKEISFNIGNLVCKY